MSAAAWITRWIGFVALAGLVGGFVVDLVVLPRAAPALEDLRRRLRLVCWLATAVLVVAAAAELWLRAAVMSGSPAAATSAIPTVLARTHYGAVWIARLAGLVVLLLIARAPVRPRRAAGALLALGIALTVSLTGHADDFGDLSPTVAIDWVHVVAASAWTGGLLVLAVVALRGPARVGEGALPDVMRRFSRLAGWCLLAVVLTGAYRVWVEVSAPSVMWRTPYGRALAAKLALVLALAWCGALNRYVMLPGLGVGRRASWPARLLRLGRLALLGPSRAAETARDARLWRSVAREAGLALAVFWCTAMLVESAPARHAQHLAHMAAAPGPVHITMADLHRAGGVPPGWLFTPPPGDAARGRQVFVDLGCPACHRVDEGSQRAAGPGPDLTDVGAHHPPGYLLESVINPDAVIVDGPGYTSPDGHSIMPSYGDRLTVTELLDLVAYLRTL
ncbi:MAG TPA: CopD family protein [Candidatus Bathyarchaeia archaeon]|nr:CopD family protein [Candidatus Bathyarchaeia archaeon]